MPVTSAPVDSGPEPEPEPEREAEPEPEADGARLLAEAVGELSAEDVDRLLRGLPPSLSGELVRELLGNRLDPRRLKNVGGLLLGPLRKRTGDRLSLLVERLSTGILASFEEQLGERFENPSLDDLRGVLDGVLAEHPAAGVRCTLALVVADDMPAAGAAREVLLTDPRLHPPG
jgi:hypothetical protein